MDNQESFFAGNRNPRFTATAPGSLDVMGGTAGYFGSLVLQMPLRPRIQVTVALRNDGLTRIRTLDAGQNPTSEIVSPGLAKPGASVEYAGDVLEQTAGGWAAYVAGCLRVLQQERGIFFQGIDVSVDSQIPVGEEFVPAMVATIHALAQAYNLVFAGTELPVLAQKAASLVTGRPCEPAGFLASHFGEPGNLLPVLCQPDHVSDPFPFPEGLHFAGINSGKPNLTENDAYSTMRTAALMGYTLLALHEGAYPHELQLARTTGQREHLLYNGYLANITPREFEDRYAWLPKQLKGSDFTDKYGFTIDPLAEVKSDETYNILQATRHPVYEHTRTQYSSLLLQHFPPRTDHEMHEKSLRQLGSWMQQSHESHAACGLGSPEMDAIVQMARENAGNGVYGARATASGAVCLLCDGEKGLATARKIREAYQRQHGGQGQLFE